MKLPRRNFLHLAAGAAALPTVSRIARAQAYPSRSVTMVVPFAAGGTTDVTLFQEQHPQAAAQADTSGTYRGYSYLVGENGVVLKLRDGGLKHFSSEEEAIAYVDSITGRA